MDQRGQRTTINNPAKVNVEQIGEPPRDSPGYRHIDDDQPRGVMNQRNRLRQMKLARSGTGQATIDPDAESYSTNLAMFKSKRHE